MAIESFSDLEVASHDDGSYRTNAHGQLDPSAPKPMLNRDDNAIPELIPWEYSGNGIHTAVKEAVPGKMPPTTAFSQSSNRKCGMPIRIFYGLLVIVVLLIIGGIAGGVAGGIISASKSAGGDNLATPDNTTPTSIPRTHVGATSKLSATNWTNPVDGTTHRFVFFQDPFHAIIVRRWDSENQKWTTSNLTSYFSRTRNPVNVLAPSTPLASVSCSRSYANSLHLYYLAPDNTITSAWVQDLVNEPDTWAYDDLLGQTFTTFPGSQIAVAWQRGYADDALGWWALVWQQKDGGGVLLANATDFRYPLLAISSEDIVRGTSLAIIPELQFNTATLSRLTMISEFLSSPTTGIVKKYNYDASWSYNGSWLEDRDIPPSSAGLQFALTRINNVTAVYCMALLPNGTITGQYWGDSLTQVPNMRFVDGPSDVNFTAIAASEENMVYGISGDSVLQYSIDGDDLSVFHFEGVVFP